MSRLLIQKYFNELDRLKKFSGSLTEGVISEAFKDLLKDWSRQKNLHFISQYEFTSPQKNRIRPDGTILHDLRVPFGYWEAKDTADDLDVEIRKKLAKGYPQDNIIFENSETAVLIQNRHEIFRCSMTDEAQLQKLVALFFGYEREEIRDFRAAVQQFKTDIPAVLKALRDRIDAAYMSNAAFNEAAMKFLAHAKETINPTIGEADVREMLIQHILTEEIFAKIFDNAEFHRENNIAKELYALEDKFFVGQVKRETLKRLETYYATIRANAALITSHAEKQTFLKVIYENFYKVYNPNAADRLGVVYTPNEIVKFMIEGADWLCQKHFSKSLIDQGVEILDPATGTGTFICELLEHFRGQPKKLAHKYKNELHANEVAILPYYVANLNIEATYAAITGQFAEFPNLCFVDTLDLTDGLEIRSGHQFELLGALSDENVERVKRQNKRKISIVIGNPPYNANQANENDNNKNRTYRHIDARISKTYIAKADSHKAKTYDMYARFIRWASDRVADEGIVAFITNRSFIEKRSFDGFRKCVEAEFSDAYVVDLGGDSRSGEAISPGNVFGIRVGVAISFFIKKRAKKAASSVFLFEVPGRSAAEKLTFISSKKLDEFPFVKILSNSLGDWDVEPTIKREAALALTIPKLSGKERSRDIRSIFGPASFGTVSNRDDWVYDHSSARLTQKVNHYIAVYNQTVRALPVSLPKDWESSNLNYEIKWTQDLRRRAKARKLIAFDEQNIVVAQYRPFSRRYFYFSNDLNWSLYQMPQAYPTGVDGNRSIFFSDRGARAAFTVLATDRVAELHLCASTDGFQSISRFRYTPSGERVDNISDWALKEFKKVYADKAAQKAVTKDAIFCYVYGVLHDPIYREKNAVDLKREFPRIPFYPDFQAWAAWGEELMALHIGYEDVEPWPLNRINECDERALAAGVAPKPILKADRDNGIIRIDTETQLSNVPSAAWSYRLGNRSGLDWILDQYKEKTPKDPTIRETFNTYRFADYKEDVIALLMRVTRVSVETVRISEAMRAVPR